METPSKLQLLQAIAETVFQTAPEETTESNQTEKDELERETQRAYLVRDRALKTHRSKFSRTKIKLSKLHAEVRHLKAALKSVSEERDGLLRQIEHAFKFAHVLFHSHRNVLGDENQVPLPLSKHLVAETLATVCSEIHSLLSTRILGGWFFHVSITAFSRSGKEILVAAHRKPNLPAEKLAVFPKIDSSSLRERLAERENLVTLDNQIFVGIRGPQKRSNASNKVAGYIQIKCISNVAGQLAFREGQVIDQSTKDMLCSPADALFVLFERGIEENISTTVATPSRKHYQRESPHFGNIEKLNEKLLLGLRDCHKKAAYLPRRKVVNQ